MVKKIHEGNTKRGYGGVSAVFFWQFPKCRTMNVEVLAYIQKYAE